MSNHLALRSGNPALQSSTFRNNIKKIGLAGKPFDLCYLPTQLKIVICFGELIVIVKSVVVGFG